MKKQPFQHSILDSFNQYGERTAVEHNGENYTYLELEHRARTMCDALLELSLTPGTFVGIYFQNRYDFICALIGTLLARHVFVPLDPKLPGERIGGMLDQTETRLILTDQCHVNQLAAMGIKGSTGYTIITAGERRDLPLPDFHRDDPIYIYFTSGSSGTPKAIKGRNKSLAHFIHWEIDTFVNGTAPRVSQLAAPSFDAILRDIFVPLCSGGTMCVPPENAGNGDTEPLHQWIDRQRIQLIHCVPSVFDTINVSSLESGLFQELRHVLLSGERIRPHKLKPWFETFGERVALVNLYGPTETTMTKTFHIIKPQDLERERIPIGQPMRGARLVLLDKHMNICDKGAVGEIYIRTPFRTHGYINAPQLNKQAFIPNPFANDPNDLLYKTGDLGCELANGDFDLLGRIDRQVKIRGVRVELEEVEATLCQHPDIEEAIAVAAEHSSGDLHLCAYVVSGKTMQELKIKEFLKEKLPEAIVPTFFLAIDTIPRTASGKIDRNQLPSPFATKAEHLVPPEDEIERELLEIWADILNVPLDSIGMLSDFFAIGGHSLNAVTLAGHIHRAFDVNIPLSDLFQAQTAKAVASYIKRAKKVAFREILPAEFNEYYPLSFGQKRFYIQWQLETQSTAYNMPVFLEIRADLSRERTQQILEQLIQRHESLRTSFPTVNGQAVQQIHDQIDFHLDYSESPEGSADDDMALINNFVRPFDLEQAPLMRAALVKKGDGVYLLMVDMHHIISDAISNGILIHDFANLFFNEELPPIKLHYRDYSQWQHSFRQSGEGRRQDDYWVSRFSGPLPVLELPYDFPRPERQNFDGDTVELEMDPGLSHEMLRLAADFRVTHYTLFLAVCTILLAKYSGQTDIVIGTPVGGRAHNDLQRIIGLFTNVLLMRNFPEPDKSFAEFLQETTANVIEAFDHQDYLLEELMERIDFKRDPGRNPLYDVVFMMRDENESALKKSRLNLKQIQYKRDTSKRDLRFEVRLTTERTAVVQLTYATALFKRETAESWLEKFSAICRQVAAAPDTPLRDIKVAHSLVKATGRSADQDGSGFGFDLDD